eukprot:g3262.t1
MSGHLGREGFRPFGAELQTSAKGLPVWVRGPCFPIVEYVQNDDAKEKTSTHRDVICYHASADPRALAILQESHTLMDFRSGCVWCGSERKLKVRSTQAQVQGPQNAAQLLEGPRICPTCLPKVCKKLEDLSGNLDDLSRFLTQETAVKKPTLSLIFLAALADRALTAINKVDHDSLPVTAQVVPAHEFRPVRRNRKRGRVYVAATNSYARCTVFAAKGHPDLLFYDDPQRCYVTGVQQSEYIEPDSDWMIEGESGLVGSRLHHLDKVLPLQVGDFVEYCPSASTSGTSNASAISRSSGSLIHFAELVARASRKHCCVKLQPLKGYQVELEKRTKYVHCFGSELRPAKVFRDGQWEPLRPKVVVGWQLTETTSKEAKELHGGVVTPRDLERIPLDDLYGVRLAIGDGSAEVGRGAETNGGADHDEKAAAGGSGEGAASTVGGTSSSSAGVNKPGSGGASATSGANRPRKVYPLQVARTYPIVQSAAELAAQQQRRRKQFEVPGRGGPGPTTSRPQQKRYSDSNPLLRDASEADVYEGYYGGGHAERTQLNALSRIFKPGVLEQNPLSVLEQTTQHHERGAGAARRWAKQFDWAHIR